MKKKEVVESDLPWKAVGDCVVDAQGFIVKAPHGCSWEGDNYRDDAQSARRIAQAVNIAHGVADADNPVNDILSDLESLDQAQPTADPSWIWGEVRAILQRYGRLPPSE